MRSKTVQMDGLVTDVVRDSLSQPDQVCRAHADDSKRAIALSSTAVSCSQ